MHIWVTKVSSEAAMGGVGGGLHYQAESLGKIMTQRSIATGAMYHTTRQRIDC